MGTIKGFDSFNEKKEEKKKEWIADAIKKPGALKKQLGKDEDEKLTKKEIAKEIKDLEKKDKDPKKKGTQLDEKDATKKRRLELAKTLKSLKENHEEGPQNYMFFGNLKTMKRLVDRLLEMDENEIDQLLTEHDWASDHISVATENLEHVFNFFAGTEDEEFNDHEEKPILGGPESSHTDHDRHMREMENSDENNIKGFEDFQ